MMTAAIPDLPKPPEIVLPLCARKIVKAVSAAYEVRTAELYGPLRTARLVRPRQVAMYLIRRQTKLSLPQIGMILNRDHTTVIHGIKRVTDLLETEAEFREFIEEMTAKLA